MIHKLSDTYTPQKIFTYTAFTFCSYRTHILTWAYILNTLHVSNHSSHGCIMTHSSSEPAASIVPTCQGSLTLTVVGSEGHMPHISVCNTFHPQSWTFLFNLDIFISDVEHHMLQLSITFPPCWQSSIGHLTTCQERCFLIFCFQRTYLWFQIDLRSTLLRIAM